MVSLERRHTHKNDKAAPSILFTNIIESLRKARHSITLRKAMYATGCPAKGQINIGEVEMKFLIGKQL